MSAYSLPHGVDQARFGEPQSLPTPFAPCSLVAVKLPMRHIGQAPMTSTWPCPECNRQFRRKNQRHACGTGNRADVLRNRPPEVVEIYGALEKFAKSLGPVEFVTRERYVLLRSNRIFADAVILSNAVRLAIHLPRKAEHKLFTKVASDRKHVTHVAKLRAIEELEPMKPFLREAYEHSVG